MIGRRLVRAIKKGIGGIDEHTILMLHGNDFVDASLNPLIIANNGVSLNVTPSKFGSGSFFFNSADARTDNYLSTSLKSSIGTGDFTIDLWANPLSTSNTGLTAYNSGGIFSLGSDTGSTRGPILRIEREGPSTGAWLGAGNYVPKMLTGTIIPINTWSHLAFVRSSGTAMLFIDGTKVASADSQNLDATGLNLVIGRTYIDLDSQVFPGYLEEIRLSNIARWTADFAPPTEPYSN